MLLDLFSSAHSVVHEFRILDICEDAGIVSCAGLRIGQLRAPCADRAAEGDDPNQSEFLGVAASILKSCSRFSLTTSGRALGKAGIRSDESDLNHDSDPTGKKQACADVSMWRSLALFSALFWIQVAYSNFSLPKLA